MKLAAHRAGRLAAALGGGIIGIFFICKMQGFPYSGVGFRLACMGASAVHRPARRGGFCVRAICQTGA